MKHRVYLETTIVSFLAARPSRDLIQAAHQQITWHWWDARRREFALFVSQLVVEEARKGDPVAAGRRLGLLRGIPVLDVADSARELAEALVASAILPAKAAIDALHLAVCAVHRIDYLLTWNCRHLANAELLAPVGRLIVDAGFIPPAVCTPEELMGG